MRPLCPICWSPTVKGLLMRFAVPVHQNLLFDTPEAAIAAPRGDLDLALCETCGYIFNRAFNESALNYGEAYKNPQADSGVYGRYMDSLVTHLLEENAIRNSRILEIGCGDGALLRRLVEEGVGNTGLGYDPSYVGPTEDLGRRLRFKRQFYNTAGCGRRQDHWVICRHVIEHVADPYALLVVIRWTMEDAGRCCRLFLETPTVEWILRNGVSWDLFYEHRSYFSEASLRTACEMVGLRVASVGTHFGGQYLWLEATMGPRLPPGLPSGPGNIPALARAFAQSDPDRIAALRHGAAELAGRGGVAIWGAAAKGVTLANLVDPDRRIVSCIVDISRQKQGRFLPGTGHPIVPPDALTSRRVTAVLLTNPIYYGEVSAIINRTAPGVELVNPLDL